MDKICYWDEKEKCQKERPCTPAEQAEINARRTAKPSAAELNAPILAQLEANDLKSIRAIRENDTARLAAIETEQVALRAQLVRE